MPDATKAPLTLEEKIDLVLVNQSVLQSQMDTVKAALVRVIQAVEPITHQAQDLKPIIAAIRIQFIRVDPKSGQISFKLPGLFS
jgi:hypothetical protein